MFSEMFVILKCIEHHLHITTIIATTGKMVSEHQKRQNEFKA
jgi:hypothetical protein